MSIWTRLSIVLIAIVILLWSRSYRTRDTAGFYWGDGQGHIEFSSANGALSLAFQSSKSSIHIVWAQDLFTEKSSRRGLSGFEFSSSPRPLEMHLWMWQPVSTTQAIATWHQLGSFQSINAQRTWVIQAPLWSIGILMTFPMILHTMRQQRVRRRIMKGLCAHCGYDLRHSKNRCPECGTSIPSPDSELCPQTSTAS